MKMLELGRFETEMTIQSIRSARRRLGEQGFSQALRSADEPTAVALRREILGMLAFLDDSVSTRELGSIFDRTSPGGINRMLRNMADAYGVAETVASTTGTTGLNAAAVISLAGENELIALGRDCHVSVIAGVCLSGARPTYVVPPFSIELGIQLPPTPQEVGQVLDAQPATRAVVLTLPTYHGIMGDIDGMVKECHKRNVVLMVDEAHGPHFRFLRNLGFPKSAEEAGADLISQSTHKVMSALNQGSLLHFNNRLLIRRYEMFQALGFQSTSFSYPILMSIEHAVEQMLGTGQEIWSKAVRRAKWLKDCAAKIPGVRALDEKIVDGHRVTGLDPTRVTLNVRGTGLTGYQLSDRLVNHGIIVEMATEDIVLFLVSPGTNTETIEITVDALKEIFLSERPRKEPPVFVPLPKLPTQVLTPRRAMQATQERVLKDETSGRISGEAIGCFPPGQAVIVPGERITPETVAYLSRAVKAGAHLKRIQDDQFQTIQVVCE